MGRGGRATVPISRRAALGAAARTLGATAAPGQDTEETKGGEEDGPESETTPLPAPGPVLFWHDVALALNALDHSVTKPLARAPGPTAPARALAVIHAAMADAVLLTSGDPFERFLFKGDDPRLAEIDVPALFVGGAVAEIACFIYDAQPQADLLRIRRSEFVRRFSDPTKEDEANRRSWRPGVDFGLSPAFRRHWNADEIMDGISRDAPG